MNKKRFQTADFMLKVIGLLIALYTPALYAEVFLHPITGQAIPFSSLKGKWVFINYWASWCDPCLHEIPELNQFFTRIKPQEMALFSVNYDSLTVNAQQKLINELQIHYPGLKKDPAKALGLGDIRGIPATFVFNPQGELVDTLYGEQTAESLQAIMRR